MISANEVGGMLETIVSRHFSDESLAFDAAGRKMIEDSLGGRNGAGGRAKPAGEFGFLPEATAVLQFVGLIHATCKIAMELYHRFKGEPDEVSQLEQRWLLALREAGVEEVRAVTIAREFASDLSKVIKGAA